MRECCSHRSSNTIGVQTTPALSMRGSSSPQKRFWEPIGSRFEAGRRPVPTEGATRLGAFGVQSGRSARIVHTRTARALPSQQAKDTQHHYRRTHVCDAPSAGSANQTFRRASAPRPSLPCSTDHHAPATPPTTGWKGHIPQGAPARRGTGHCELAGPGEGPLADRSSGRAARVGSPGRAGSPGRTLRAARVAAATPTRGLGVQGSDAGRVDRSSRRPQPTAAARRASGQGR